VAKINLDVVPIIIDENAAYKLKTDDGFRHVMGGDLMMSHGCLVAIRAAGLDSEKVAALLAEYLEAADGDIS